jgi:hypothetical protein
LAGEFEGEGGVALDGHVREEAGLLDDVADGAAEVGEVVIEGGAAVDEDLA